jgi:hypothetical protein
MGAPGLDFQTWETTNLNHPFLVFPVSFLSGDSEVCEFPEPALSHAEGIRPVPN